MSVDPSSTLFFYRQCFTPDDCKKLYTDYAVTTRSCVDLSLLARSVDNPRWKGKYSLPIGLMRLCEAYEELTLSKGKVQRSNWEAVLSEQQQECMSGLHAQFCLHYSSHLT